MEPRISIITLGVTDLPRSVEFYRDGLRLPLFDKNTESIAFFQNRGTWLPCTPASPWRQTLHLRGRQRLFRCHAGSQRTLSGGGGRPAGSGHGRWGHPRQAGGRHILGRLLRILCRPGGLPMGSRLEPPLLDRVTGPSYNGTSQRNVCSCHWRRGPSHPGRTVPALQTNSDCRLPHRP